MCQQFHLPTDLDAYQVSKINIDLQAISLIKDDIVLDMSLTEFMDSTGVGALIQIYKNVTSSGYKFFIKGANEQPLYVLTHLRLAELFCNE